MKKKLISLVLSLSMTLSFAVIPAHAASYPDIVNHWGEEAIEIWSDYGIVEGDDLGNFNPDNFMTRAEAATVFVRLLGLKATTDISAYKDVKNDDWFYDAISKCVASGIMIGITDDEMSPNGTLTREQMFVMFARAMGIKEETAEKNAPDQSDISDWSEGYINALVNNGYVEGMEDGRIAPKLNINRASVMALLKQTVTTYANKPGTVTAQNKGITLVIADNVTVKNAADIIVVAGGDNNVTVDSYTGSLNAVADNSIITVTSKIDTVNVEGDNVTIKGTGAVVNVNANGNGTTVTTAGTTVTAGDNATGTKAGEKEIASGETAVTPGKLPTVTPAPTATTSPSPTPTKRPSGGGGGTTVIIPTSTLTLNKEAVRLQLGTFDDTDANTYHPNINGSDSDVKVVRNGDANDTITWASDNETVAKVENGKISAIGVGEATITATANNKSASCKVFVVLPDAGDDGKIAELPIYAPGTVVPVGTKIRNVTVYETVGTGDVTLNNVNIDTLTTKAGGENSIHLRDSVLGTVVMDSNAGNEATRLVFSKATVIENSLTVKDDVKAIIDAENSEIKPSIASLEIEGNTTIKNIKVQEIKAKNDIVVENSTVTTIKADTKDKVSITLDEKTKVDEVKAKKSVEIKPADSTKDSKKIDKITVEADGINVTANVPVGEIKPTKDENDTTKDIITKDVIVNATKHVDKVVTMGTVDLKGGGTTDVENAKSLTVSDGTSANAKNVTDVEVKTAQNDAVRPSITITGTPLKDDGELDNPATASTSLKVSGDGKAENVNLNSTAKNVTLNFDAPASSLNVDKRMHDATINADAKDKTIGDATKVFTDLESITPDKLNSLKEVFAKLNLIITTEYNQVPQYIKIEHLPNKTAYFTGDSFDYDGLSVTLYSSLELKVFDLSIPVIGELITKELTTADLDVSTPDMNTPGTQTVTVTHTDTGKTTSFPITVTNPDVIAASVSTAPTKLVYDRNEAIDVAGGMIKYFLNNGYSNPISMNDSDVTISTDNDDDQNAPDEVGPAVVTVTYTHSTTGTKVTTHYPIIVVDRYADALEAAKSKYKYDLMTYYTDLVTDTSKHYSETAINALKSIKDDYINQIDNANPGVSPESVDARIAIIYNEAIEAMNAVSEEGAEWAAKHATVLGKTVGTIAISDKAAVEAAIADYNNLHIDEQTDYATQKTLLDNLLSAINAQIAAAADLQDKKNKLTEAYNALAPNTNYYEADKTALENAYNAGITGLENGSMSLENALKSLSDIPTKLVRDKETAIKELTDYFNDKQETNVYDNAGKAELENILNVGISEINKASNSADVNTAKLSAIALMDKVKTDAQKKAEALANAKKKAIEEINTFGDINLYRQEDQTDFKQIKIDAIANINAAADINRVNTIVSDSKAAINALPTDAYLTAKELEDAKNAAISYLNSTYAQNETFLGAYRDAQKESIKNIVNNSIQIIKNASTKEAVDIEKANAEKAIRAIKTGAILDAEEAAKEQQELEAYLNSLLSAKKSEAITRLDTYATDLDKYTEAVRAEIESIISDATSDINAVALPSPATNDDLNNKRADIDSILSSAIASISSKNVILASVDDTMYDNAADVIDALNNGGTQLVLYRDLNMGGGTCTVTNDSTYTLNGFRITNGTININLNNTITVIGTSNIPYKTDFHIIVDRTNTGYVIKRADYRIIDALNGTLKTDLNEAINATSTSKDVKDLLNAIVTDFITPVTIASVNNYISPEYIGSNYYLPLETINQTYYQPLNGTAKAEILSIVTEDYNNSKEMYRYLIGYFRNIMPDWLGKIADKIVQNN